MHLRPFVASCMLVLAVLASHKAEASAILFTNRGAFDAALNGEDQLFTEFPITDFSLLGSNFTGIGDYGGVRFAGDIFNQISFGSVLSTGNFPRSWFTAGLSAGFTR